MRTMLFIAAARAAVAATLCLLPRAVLAADVVITAGDASGLEKGILDAYNNGQAKVVIPEGTYRFAAVSGRTHALQLPAMTRVFEIDAVGATLILPRVVGGVEFKNCRNITLKGLAMEHEVPTTTQGRVVAIDAAGTHCDVRIDAGYPADMEDRRYFSATEAGYLFEVNTGAGPRWKAGSRDIYPKVITKQAPDLVRLTLPDGVDVRRFGAVVGDRMAFRGALRPDVSLTGCAAMTVTGVTIRNGSGFAVHEIGGDGGSRYSNLTVTYGARPAGAAEADVPLLPCVADAFHSTNVRTGPIVENCRFEGMPDDGIAIHGTWNLIAEVNAAKTVVVVGGTSPVAQGDTLRLVGPDGAPLGSAIVSVKEPLAGYAPPAGLPQSRWRTYADLTKTQTWMRLTLDRPLTGIAYDCLAGNVDACGRRFVLVNNHISRNRARGILIKSVEGTISGNTLEDNTFCGIAVSPEVFWTEAAWAFSMTIKNNTIRRTGYAHVSGTSVQAGAISITSVGEGNTILPFQGHSNVRIEANVIEDVPGVNILVASAKRVTVKNNRFVRSHQTATRVGADRGIDPTAAIYLTQCSNVWLEGNTAEQSGPFFTALLVKSATATLAPGPLVAIPAIPAIPAVPVVAQR